MRFIHTVIEEVTTNFTRLAQGVSGAT